MENPPAIPAAARLDLVLANVARELSALPPYIGVMRRHLQGATRDTETGVLAVIERIHASLDQCEAMMGVTRQQAGTNQEVVALVRAEMQVQLEALNSNIERTLGLANEVRDLRRIVETINDIAGQTHLLAINAAVQSTHAGQFGAGFAVVAGEVKTLSRRTSGAAREISAKIDSLSERMTAELALAKKALDQKLSGTILERIIRDVGAMEARFDASSEGLLKVMGNIRQANDDLVTQLGEALGYIQFQDVVRQRIEQVEGALQEVGEHAVQLAGKLGEADWDGAMYPGLTQRLDRHLAGYVMASQREAHAEAFGGSAQGGSDGPAIELF